MFDPIFPGMDPFIEGQRWAEFHGALIVGIQHALARLLVPQYDVSAETYIYLQMRPDVSVFHRGKPGTEPLEQSSLGVAEATRSITPTIEDPDDHRRVEIRDADGRLVTVVEVLLPSNKTSHRDRYIANRSALMSEGIHLIEIDLIRVGQHMEAEIDSGRYAALVVRARDGEPHRGELYEFGLRDPLPVIPVPLMAGDDDVPLDLPGIFKQVYVSARYRLQLDYARLSDIPIDERDFIQGRLEANQL